MSVRAAVEDSIADLPAGACVVVACSGGPDSLALAGAAAWAGPRRDILIHAVVVDHGLQEGSAHVAADAARACLALGVATADVIEVEVGKEGGPEAAARAARFGALAAAAERLDASAVLLGHTRDDQAETVLLRLARGSGARALSAMRARSDPWRRPFLGLARSEVHEAAAELLGPTGRQAWRDPHNVDLAYARVRVRELLAGLGQALGPGVAVGLSRSAELLRDDADALDSQAEQAFAACVVATDVDVSAEAKALIELPRALRTRVIRLMGLRAGCPSEELGYERVVEMEALVVDWHGQGALRLPGRVAATGAYGRLSLRRGEE